VSGAANSIVECLHSHCGSDALATDALDSTVSTADGIVANLRLHGLDAQSGHSPLTLVPSRLEIKGERAGFAAKID
jgi:hypothetical protein